MPNAKLRKSKPVRVWIVRINGEYFLQRHNANMSQAINGALIRWEQADWGKRRSLPVIDVFCTENWLLSPRNLNKLRKQLEDGKREWKICPECNERRLILEYDYVCKSCRA